MGMGSTMGIRSIIGMGSKVGKNANYRPVTSTWAKIFQGLVLIAKLNTYNS